MNLKSPLPQRWNSCEQVDQTVGRQVGGGDIELLQGTFVPFYLLYILRLQTCGQYYGHFILECCTTLDDLLVPFISRQVRRLDRCSSILSVDPVTLLQKLTAKHSN